MTEVSGFDRRTRVAPPGPGADTRRRITSPDEIRRELDTYLKPYLKA
jgi:hypothetical protein